MKRRLCMISLIALAFAWATPVFAQSNATRFNIPFNFQVGRQQLPAGEYRLSAVGEKALMIRQIEGNQAVVAMTKAPLENPAKNGRLRLVFNRYGDRCFLAEAWLNSSSGRELPKSAEEAEYARSTSRETAVVYAKADSD